MNTISSVIQERISVLASELDRDIQLHMKNGQRLLFVVQFMMVITVLSSILAGFGGLFHLWKQEVVGALALVPGIMAFVAATMRFPKRPLDTRASETVLWP